MVKVWLLSSIAHSWNVPLIKCDLGKLFGSYVGDTEANTRKALQIAEAMAPCVLWIDEIEKGLAGAGSGGRNDSGVSSRMFASILTWMPGKGNLLFMSWQLQIVLHLCLLNF